MRAVRRARAEAKRQTRRRLAIGAAVAGALAVVGVVAYLVWVYGGNAARPGASATATLAPSLTPAAGQTVLTLDPSRTQATFTINEVLLGNPNTVVGSTNQVTGQILIDPNDPSKSRVGQIRVDMSTLVTDNDMRNHTLQGRILETGDPSNQYATFDPTSYKGLPSTIAAGQTVTFQVTGNLTIHGVTKAETFDITLTATSATQVAGKATTTVRYQDFNISIPNVPSVSDVSDNVVLALTFTAQAG